MAKPKAKAWDIVFPFVGRTVKSHDKRHGYREGQSSVVTNAIDYIAVESYLQNMADQEAKRSLIDSL